MAARGEDLRRIGDFEALCRYLEDTLGWPLGEGEYDFDALTFEYAPEELGLLDHYADAIESIHQLRPVVDGQPWGIFFVRFRKKKLPVGVLRRILSQLALKKRASANKAERAAWKVDDLLFVSAFGDEARNREIAFAHFHQHGSDLPTLRVVGWDGNDTPLKLEYLQGVLADKLRWPSDPTDAETWRKLWRSSFRHRPGHVIRKSDELAEELAKLARAIRDRAQAVMKAESTKGPLTKLYDAFKKALIHDLTPEGFADTYAQTITYGLLTAAISRTEMSEGRHGTALLASDLADMVPVTNPFLKEMLQTFLEAGGRKGGIDFDELGVQDVVELLRGEDTDLPAILRDFGNKTRGEDPVIHFYEHFLKAYNKQLKVQRGVFYTPQPVVAYIVRGVHESLQVEFGLEDGLADTTTWGEMLEKHPEMKLPQITDSSGDTQTISPKEPFVQILDPATGTATFLVEVIDVIYKEMTKKWAKRGLSEAKRNEAWNDYVPTQLLPRLHGFELMMAPYAIAHMKIGLKLAETGYRFESGERARIYLTNALEPWTRNPKFPEFEALAHEAESVNAVKRDKKFTVVIGNPPYSGLSANMSEEAARLIEQYKYVDGVHFGERKHWLHDDYVKFVRLCETVIASAGAGVVGVITNHAFYDNPTFRGMRWNLLQSFDRVRLLDLHGNAMRREKTPDGSDDKNVFDIQQGVAISILTRTAKRNECLVSHGEVWGSREKKYGILARESVNALSVTELSPSQQFYFFIPRTEENSEEYELSLRLNEIFAVHAGGFITARDHFVIDFDRKELLTRISAFADATNTDSLIRERYFAGCGSDKYPDGDTRGWKLPNARQVLRKDLNWKRNIRRCLYRPFDERWIYWTEGMVDWPRPEVNGHLLNDGNLGLVFMRQVASGDGYSHFFVSRLPVDARACYSNKGIMTLAPLYLHAPPSRHGELAFDQKGVRPNFTPAFCSALRAKLGHESEELGYEDVFHYAYAVFHSPGYRSRYAELLKIDFPRLPLTGNLELFRALARLGGELTALHLLESSRLAQPLTEFIGGRNPEVEKVSWSRDTVWVDKAQTTGFRGVPEPVWNFHIGGYQVCHKWLKDRKGRTLSKDNIAQYHKIVVALSETIRLMAEIDRVIGRHGDWPGAFHAPPSDIDVAEPANDPFPDEARPARRSARSVGRGMPSDLFQAVPVRKVADDGDRARTDPQDTDELVAEARALFAEGKARRRDQAIDGLRGKLAYRLPEGDFRQRVDDILRTCVRRGILDNDAGALSLRYRSLAEHAQDDRDGLKTQFLASLNGRAWTERDEAIAGFARWMGFRRTGARIGEIAESLVKGLLREGRLERDGSRIRRS